MSYENIELTEEEKAECADRAREIATRPNSSQGYETILKIQESNLKREKADQAAREAREKRIKERDAAVKAQREEREAAKLERWSNPEEYKRKQALKEEILAIHDDTERLNAIAANMELFE